MIVYCVRRAPSGSTMKMKPEPVRLAAEEAGVVDGRGEDRRRRWRGVRARRTGSRTMAAAPNTCHQTETLLRMASRWLEKMLTTRGDDQDDQEVEEDRVEVARRVAAREQEAEREVEEGRAAVGDRGDDGEQPDEVQPAGVVAGLGAAELGRPPVDAARRREGRHQLGHAEPDDEDEDRDDRPAPGDRRRAAVVPAAPKVVKQPARIEMIENEIAKLEKPDQERFSSCL